MEDIKEFAEMLIQYLRCCLSKDVNCQYEIVSYNNSINVYLSVYNFYYCHTVIDKSRSISRIGDEILEMFKYKLTQHFIPE